MKARTETVKKGRCPPVTDGKGLNVRVIAAKEAPRFEELLKAKHYLGPTRRIGDFLQQVVERDGEWIGLLVWGPAGLHLKDRDRWIGWNPLQRAERLKLVVQNRRFLLLRERGQEPNLASQTLAAAVRALPGQWAEHFGYQPVLAESFTDVELYEGTCYRASGWEALGLSAGFSRHRADFYVPNDRPKRLWVRRLRPDATAILCAATLAPPQRAAETPATSGVLPLSQPQMRSLLEALRAVKDPRARNTRFRLAPVLAIVAMALLCGQRDISQFHRFGWRLRQNQRALLGLPFKRGSRKLRDIPSYSVYYQLLSRLDLDGFAAVLNAWLQQRAGELPGALAMDGKMIRDCIGVVTLAEHETGVPRAMAVMSQKEGESERCELRVAQTLLDHTPTLSGQVVTGDALHTQRATARRIIEKGGEYVLQIKDNQPTLLKTAERTFAVASPLLP
jgi:hypothetical protein